MVAGADAVGPDGPRRRCLGRPPLSPCLARDVDPPRFIGPAHGRWARGPVRETPEPVVSPPRRRRASGPTGVWALTLALAVATAALFALGVVPLSPKDRTLELPWPILALLFAAAEVCVVQLHLRRDAHAFSLSEIPLVIGLASVSPVVFVGARMLGTGAAFVLHWRQRGVKLTLNQVTVA